MPETPRFSVSGNDLIDASTGKVLTPNEFNQRATPAEKDAIARELTARSQMANQTSEDQIDETALDEDLAKSPAAAPVGSRTTMTPVPSQTASTPVPESAPISQSEPLTEAPRRPAGAPPSLPEYLEKARPLNPEFDDREIAIEYRKQFPDANKFYPPPPKDQWIAKAKEVNPEAEDTELNAFYTDVYGEPEQPQSSSVVRRVADIPLGLARGAAALPGALVGVADIPTMGMASRVTGAVLDVMGEGADALGLPSWARPSQWKSQLAALYSPEAKAAITGVHERAAAAEAAAAVEGAGAFGQIGASLAGGLKGVVEHPGALVPLAAENYAGMKLIAMGVAKVLAPFSAELNTAVKAGTMTEAAASEALGAVAVKASAIGEGLLTAGQVSEGIQEKDPNADFEHRLAAAVAGLFTGGIARAVGAIPGLGDAPATMAVASLGQRSGFSGGAVGRIGKGVLSEGVLQEPLQSGQETAFENLGASRPFQEGVGEQVVLGGATGGVMGGGAAGLHGARRSSAPGEPPPEEPPTTTPPPTTPLETVAPVLQAQSVDEAIATSAKINDQPVVSSAQLDTAIGVEPVSPALSYTDAHLSTDQVALERIFGGKTVGDSPVRAIDPRTLPVSTSPTEGMSQEKYEAFDVFASVFGLHLSIFKSAPNLPNGVHWQSQDPTRVHVADQTTGEDHSIVLKHEIIHSLKGSPFYEAFKQTILEQQTPHMMAALRARHDAPGVTPLSEDDLLNEAASDIGSNELEKEDLWRKVFAHLREKVGDEQAKVEVVGFIDSLKQLIARIKTLVATRQLSVRGKTLTELYVKDIEKVQDVLAQVVGEALYNKKFATPEQAKAVGKLTMSRRQVSDRTVLPKDVAETFSTVASLQREKPEAAMRAVQKATGHGLMANAVEQVGDLSHRMAAGARAGTSNRLLVKEKVDKLLTSLTHAYGFEKEHAENLANNQADQQAVDAALKAYVAEHKALPVYNRAQWLARAAAIAVGEMRIKDAVAHLKALKTMVDSADFAKEAFAHRRNADQSLQSYLQPVPGKLIGRQILNSTKMPDFDLYDLDVDLPGHPKGSTVTQETMADEGYRIVPSDLITAKESKEAKERGPAFSPQMDLSDTPETRRTLSTTVPRSKRSTNDAYTQQWVIGTEDIRASKTHLNALVAAIKSYAMMSGKGGKDAVLNEFKRKAVDNLLWLYDLVPAPIRARAKRWYEGANRLATEWSAQDGYTDKQHAGVLAVLSPQKDWFMNVSLADRLRTIVKERAAFPWSPAMSAWAESYRASAKTADALAAADKFVDAGVRLEGLALENLSDVDAALFVRAYDQTYHERAYRTVTPEGEFADYVVNKQEVERDLFGDVPGVRGTVAWGSQVTIEKAISILRDGSNKNITTQLGNEHKVRNFYNNILEPHSTEGHVTIDTHAMAAAVMKAISANAKEVLHLFGRAGSNAETGASGSYGLIADVYREAARQRNVLPREMQSVTWEAVRGLFPREQKKTLGPKVDAIWAQVKKGSLTPEQARARIFELAGGVSAFAWEKYNIGLSAAEGGRSFDVKPTSKEGEQPTFAPKTGSHAVELLSAALPTTTSPKLTRFLLPDGRRLAGPKDKNFDAHFTLANHAGTHLDEVILGGAVRYAWPNGGVEIGKALTTKQAETIVDDWAATESLLTIDIKDNLGSVVASHEFDVLNEEITPSFLQDWVQFNLEKGDTPRFNPKGTAKLVHYSRETDLAEISPKYHGTGQIGAERLRQQNEGKAYIPRSFFYRAKTKIEPRFKGLTTYQVEVPESSLVDLATLKGTPTERERAAKKAGYKGYYNSESSMPNVVAMFTPVNVGTSAQVSTVSAQQFLIALNDQFNRIERVGVSDAQRKSILEYDKNLSPSDTSATAELIRKLASGVRGGTDIQSRYAPHLRGFARELEQELRSDPLFSPRTWVSQIEKVLDQKMPKKASAAQVKGILSAQNGVKADELAEMGIDEYLASKETFDKHNVMEWVRAHQIQAERVTLADLTSEAITTRRNAVYAKYAQSVNAVSARLSAAVDAAFAAQSKFHVDSPELRQAILDESIARDEYAEILDERAFELNAVDENSSQTQFPSWQLPGGTNYQEVFATLPKEPDFRLDDYITELSKKYGYKEIEGTNGLGQEPAWDESDLTPDELAKLNELRDGDSVGKRFILSDWRAEEAAEEDRDVWKVSASRPDGSKWVYHVDRDAYPEKDEAIEFARVYAYGFESNFITPPGVWRDGHDAYATIDNPIVRLRTNDRTTSDGKKLLFLEEMQPPRKDEQEKMPAWAIKRWREIGLKQALRMAAEGGYDAIGWTTGAQQADRYSLRKHLDEIIIRPNPDTVSFYIEGRRVGNVDTEPLARHAPKESLHEYIGDELAAKVLSGEAKVNTEGWFVFTDLDLEMGGHGLAKVYDKDLVNAANGLWKKYGVKVGSATIRVHPPDGSPISIETARMPKQTSVHTLPVTDAMKQVAMEGQPLFAPKPKQPKPAPTWTADQPGKLDAVIRVLQDKAIDIKRLTESVQKAGRVIPDQLNPVLAEEMYMKRSEQRAADFTNDELRPFVQQMQLAKVTVEQVDQYLQAYHIITDDVNTRLQTINPDLQGTPEFDRLAGMSDAEAKAILANASPAMAKLAGLAQKMVEKTRDLMVTYGLESQDRIDEWRKQYQAYVPLHREGFEEAGHPTGTGRSVRGSTAKTRTGSGLAVTNVLANIAQARDQIITRGEKQRPVIAMAGLLMLHPNPEIATLDKPAQMTMIHPQTGLPVTIPGHLTNYTVPMIRRFDPVSGTVKTYPDPTYKGRDNVVNFRVDGKDYAIVFNERNERAMEAAKAFKELDTPKLTGIMAAIAPYTRYLASVNTQYNPIFGIVNFVRDAQFAMLALGSTPLAGKKTEVLKNAIQSLSGIYQDARAVRLGRHPSSPTAQMWERFQHVGGPTGYRDLFFSSTDRAEEIRRMLEPNTLEAINSPQKFGKRMEETWLLKALSDYNTTMENAIRLGVFTTAVQQGMSDLQAASYAKNITVNFNKKGQIGAQMGSLYAFFNANVQGTARIFETIFERTPTGIQLSAVGKKLVAGGLLVGVLQTFALAMAGFGDDEPPEYIKARNLVIPVPGTQKGYLLVPMPLGFNLLPNVGRAAAEAVRAGVEGRDVNPAKRMVDLIGAIYGTFSPLGGTGGAVQEFLPTVADPVAAIASNRDWTGKKISKEDLDPTRPTPGHARARDTASHWATFLSHAINWATGGTKYTPGVLSPTPDAVDYLIEQVTGGIGRELSKGSQVLQSTVTGEELPFYKVPLLGRFAGSAEGATAVRSTFYDNVKKVNLAYDEFVGRATDRTGDAHEFLRTHPEGRLREAAISIERTIGELNKVKKDLVEQGAPRAAVRVRETQITGLMERFNQMVAQQREASR